MSELGKEILDKIKKENIAPKPKWQCLLKDYSVWLFFGASIIVGSFSVGVLIYLLTDMDWFLYRHIDKGFLEYLIVSLPYLWVLLLIVFFSLALFNLKHTKKAYKHKNSVLILLSIIISSFLGSGIYAAGLGEAIDKTLIEKVPTYRKLLPLQVMKFADPEAGMLVGEIVALKDMENFEVKDFEQKIWQVYGQRPEVRGRLGVEVGQKVRCLGNKINDKSFEVIVITPFGKRERHWINANISHMSPPMPRLERNPGQMRSNN